MRNRDYRSPLKALPLVFTFANAVWGVLAIVKALEGELTTAVYCIMIAALMDACDGRCARALGATTQLGAELDSLADVVSFCVAPAVLVYAWYPGTIGVSGLMALTCYLCAGLYRLARFNITIDRQSGDAFTGLPVPMAAFFVSSMVLYYHWISTHSIWFVVYKRVPFILLIAIAFLMVSHIPFPSGKRYRWVRTWRQATALFLVWGGLIMLCLKGYPLIFFAISVYIISGIGVWLYRRCSV